MFPFTNQDAGTPRHPVRLLALFASFGGLLVLVRMIITLDVGYLFLVWNLFLAWLPYLITRWLAGRPLTKFSFCSACIFWLLLLPNSFYIITDLFHLHTQQAVPIWFDLAIIFSFAWTGLWLGVLSVAQMEQQLLLRGMHPGKNLFLYPLMALNGLGIYIGRYLRYNSWDVLSNPGDLSADLNFLVFHPLRNRMDWSMITIYSVLLLLVYLTIRRLGRLI